MELYIGYILQNRYRIDALLGQGGFGITYLAYDLNMRRQIAIKELFISGSSTRSEDQTVCSVALDGIPFDDFKAKFLREAQELAGIEHPNIVNVYDHFEANNTAYYSMAYVEGMTLQALVARNGPLAAQDAVNVIDQLMNAVEELHRRNKLHRDLKPANVMISSQWKVVLIDFGTTRDFGDGRTVSTVAMVTQGYSPLEQYGVQSLLDERSDLYALGATLYFLLTGVRPLPAPNRNNDAFFTPPHAINPQIDENKSNAVMRALAMRPADRFQSVADFRHALTNFPDPPPPPPPHPPPGPPCLNILIAIITILALVIGIGLFLSSVDGPSHTGPKPKPRGSLRVDSTPKGAEVWVYGKRKGITPYTLIDLSPGTHTIEFKKHGYINLTSSVFIETGKDKYLRKTLSPIPVAGELDSDGVAPIQQLIDDMVPIQGGKFTMGCTSEQGSDCLDWERPPHTVTLPDFSIGRYEVTQLQWRAVMGTDPPQLHNKGCDLCPVEGVSWAEVQDFIQKLNDRTGYVYRLPTEAEWEYAARGGNRSDGYKFSGSYDITEVAWYDRNAKHGNMHGVQRTTRPVGGLSPNELDLYDMSGNVSEWCSDWYAPYPGNNNLGNYTGIFRVNRGGSWINSPQRCRISGRVGDKPKDQNYATGFRLARSD